MANPTDMVTLKLSRNDLGQIVDGLRERQNQWRVTAESLEGGGDWEELEEVGTLECSDAQEARGLEEHYAHIVAQLEKALASPHSADCPSHILQEHDCECGARFGGLKPTPSVFVRSSHGFFEVDEQGTILRRVVECPKPCEDGCLPEATRFDFDEWRKFWNLTDMHAEVDILDVGYWYAGGYEPADADWRADRHKETEEMGL